ncbi:MAG: hypothetical protein HN849_20400 [Victivallales bacterium]|nr:hypothetical protein [Victivallales bacterium]
MAFTVYILSVLVLFFVSGAFPAAQDAQTIVFRSPVFIALMGALCGACVVCVAQRDRLWKRPGFVLCHLAVVLIGTGAFAGFRYGKKTTFRAPVTEEHSVSELPKPDGTHIDLDFGISITAARADYYPPKSYAMYAPPEYDLVCEIEIKPDGMLDLKPELQPEADALHDEDGNWAEQVVLTDGNLLQLMQPTVKYYEGTLKFVHDDAPSDTHTIAVNHPVSYRGWRFYLMDYSTEPYLNVSLAARRDPGRVWVIIGIWMLIVGTAWLCWRPRGQTA